MIGDDRPRAFEPERGDLREDLALVGNARAEHVVEGRDAIGRDDQQAIAEIVDVADLSLSIGRRSASVVWRMGEASDNKSSAEERCASYRVRAGLTTTTCRGVIVGDAQVSMRSHVRTVVVLALAVGLIALFLHNVDLRRVGGRDPPGASRMAGAVAGDDVRQPVDSRAALAVPARAARPDDLRERVPRHRRRFRGEQRAAGARRRADSPLLPGAPDADRRSTG